MQCYMANSPHFLYEVQYVIILIQVLLPNTVCLLSDTITPLLNECHTLTISRIPNTSAFSNAAVFITPPPLADTLNTCYCIQNYMNILVSCVQING